MSKKLVLGLDIGVGSVGWGIIDRGTGEIVDKGVRLFSELDPENNAKRRMQRHIRRSLRRREFRLYRTRRLLLEANIIDKIDFLPLDNPYEIRCKGLKQKLNKAELATALLHLMKRNGFRYEIADDEIGGVKSIKENYLCEHQLQKLQTEGKVRGIENKYSFSLYEKEFKKLIEVQKIDEVLANKLMEIFSKRRHFSDGPGGPNSPSIYGKYLYLNAEPINLIDKMRGHCSVYKNELRAPKICPHAELFNFLNDLNNITIDGSHISCEVKNDIIETYILGKGKITVRQLADKLGTTEDNINGLRINAKGKPLLTEFESLKKINKAAKENAIPEFEIDGMEDFDLLDKVFEVLTKSKSIEERKEELKLLNNLKLTDQWIDAFSRMKKVIGYHSLSLRALKEIAVEMCENNLNSQQIIMNIEQDENAMIELRLPKDIIMSPVVYKSVNQTFKIVKAILKKYGQLDAVVIEMTREKNSKEEKDNINKALKFHEKEKQEVMELIKGHFNGEVTKDIIDLVFLYNEQDGKSPYSGKPIDLERLLAHPTSFEIDHIIPYSISLDDSRSNKVLVYANENQLKGQRTPYQAFTSVPNDWWSFSDFEAYVKNGHFGKKKKELLLTKEDINDDKIREEFINRNLSDTRYMTRVVLNALKSYFSVHEIETKVHVINGVTTSVVRRMANIRKNRDFYCHHAVDALIAASILKSTYLSKILDKRFYDEETGVVYTLKDNKEIFGPIAESVARQLFNLDPISDYKFSYKVDTKPNRCLCDETLYGTRYVDGILKAIKKYKNIYEKDGETLTKNIRLNKQLDSLLIKQYDPKTFALLKKVVDSYPNEKNAFKTYFVEHGEYIKKVGAANKKNPSVVSLRYIESAVNSAIDLSKYYKKGKNPNVGGPVKLQLSPYRMDLYKDKKTGQYRFVTIRYINVQQRNNKYYINQTWYECEKTNMHITNDYDFVNSFYRGNLIKIEKDDKSEINVFKTVNNGLKSTIEVSHFGKATKKKIDSGEYKPYQHTIPIGKSVKNIEKLSTDLLGNIFKVKNEPLKLEW